MKLNKRKDNKGNLKLLANEAVNCLNTYGLRLKRSLGFLWVAVVRADFQEMGVLWS